MRATTTAMTVLLALGACNWTKFDDLADGTWANATSKPNVKSSEWGVAIQRGANAADSANAGTLAIIGAGNTNTFSELTYDEGGASHFAPNTIDLSALGVKTIEDPAFFLASPTSSEVALVNEGDAASIVVASGKDTLDILQLFVGNTSLHNTANIVAKPTAATYMRAKEFPTLPGSNANPAPLVAVGTFVLGTIPNLSGNAQPACRLSDGTNAIDIQALGAVAAGATDDVLAWSKDGRLFRYPGDVFNGCDAAATPTAPTATAATKPAFNPGRGSQILTIDATQILLVGQDDDAGGKPGFLQVFTSNTLAPVGNPVTIAGLHSAALLDVGATKYVVAGYPTALVGSTQAGQVLIFKLAASGLDTTQVASLNDAQPEDNQTFGRAVTVMPYRGKNVIAVAAANEIFVYFRAMLEDGTALYDETRQGK